MRNGAQWLIVTMLVCSAAADAQVNAPQHIVVDGGTQLRLVSQARRTHLLGTVDLYTIAIYSDGEMSREGLSGKNAAKALRIEVAYTEDLRRRMALDWRRELVPRLEAQAVAHLRGSFAPIRNGDVVSVEYTPAKGTAVRINKAVAVSGAHHDLMLAFLDHWLGGRPVSEEIKRTLLGAF